MEKIIYSQNVRSSFATKDLQVLESAFFVAKFEFIWTSKLLVPVLFLKQFFFLLYHLPTSKATVTLFGSYHSFLPALMARVFGKPAIVILGGSDCVSFPSINYGNFNNGLQGVFTRWSLNLATHIAPVHESLKFAKYDYTDTDFPNQGYTVFCPKANAPCTAVYFGYDADLFQKRSKKVPGSFLTVGTINPANFYRKGVDLILADAENRPENTYTIIGGTKEDLPVDTIVPPNVRLIKSVSYQDLTNHYSTHQFYFQLSMMEGFPSAICEAMLCECVPIGSNVAAIPDIIGDSGFLLFKKDVDELRLLVDQALNAQVAELGSKARQRIIQNYPKGERMKLLDVVRAEIKE